MNISFLKIDHLYIALEEILLVDFTGDYTEVEGIKKYFVDIVLKNDKQKTVELVEDDILVLQSVLEGRK